MAVGVLLAAPAAAQEVDCARAVTQVDMNACARLDWEAADAELNLAYAGALVRAEAFDTHPEGRAEETLRAAQRAWVPYRDALCESEAALWDGGSAEPMVRSGCLAAVTRERTEDLRTYAGG